MMAARQIYNFVFLVFIMVLGQKCHFVHGANVACKEVKYKYSAKVDGYDNPLVPESGKLEIFFSCTPNFKKSIYFPTFFSSMKCIHMLYTLGLVHIFSLDKQNYVSMKNIILQGPRKQLKTGGASTK